MQGGGATQISKQSSIQHAANFVIGNHGCRAAGSRSTPHQPDLVRKRRRATMGLGPLVTLRLAIFRDRNNRSQTIAQKFAGNHIVSVQRTRGNRAAIRCRISWKVRIFMELESDRH